MLLVERVVAVVAQVLRDEGAGRVELVVVEQVAGLDGQ